MAFEALADPDWDGEDPLARALHAAARRRSSLFEAHDALRLFDAERDGPQRVRRDVAALAQATIERFGEHAVSYVTELVKESEQQAIARALLTLGARSVYLKLRARTDLRRRAREEFAPEAPLLGEAAPREFVVREGELRFWVRLGDGLSTGLFLDQRDNRQRVRCDCAGARVLNLFAYTGSFSVAAGLGGAAQVTSVDLSRTALERAGRNLELNALPREQHRLLRADARDWLGRASRRGERFDWIVLDPPSFASGERGAFRASEDYAGLVLRCVELLSPGGRLLAVSNHRKTSPEELERLVREAAAQQRRGIRRLEHPTAPLDCASGGEAATKSVLLSLDAAG